MFTKDPFSGHAASSTEATEVGTGRTAPRLVTVLICARNAASEIGFQLEALSTQVYQGAWELIVVNNGSSDHTEDVVRSFEGRIPGLKVVQASERAGLNYARNVGIRESSGDFILFCDADDVVAPGWLAAMASAAHMADGLGGRLEMRTLNDEETWALRPEETLEDMPIVARFLPRPVSANCGFWKDVWESLSGFNDSYDRGGTETEFFWRMQLAGYRIEFVPDAVVHYRFRPGPRSLARQFYLFGRGHARLFRDFRDKGMPRGRIRELVRLTLWLIVHLPYLFRGPDLKGRWLRTAALRWGRIRGSIEFRVFYP